MLSYEQLLTEIASYVGLDSLDEATSIYEEAELGNKVAQYMVGMALADKQPVQAQSWLTLSAKQGYAPATRYFKVTCAPPADRAHLPA